jgi:carboxyl-terminal processing protease
VLQWRASNVVGEARALDLAKLGDRQLERATDVLKGLLVYEQFNKEKEKPAAPAPVEPVIPPTKEGAPKPSVLRELTKPDVR